MPHRVILASAATAMAVMALTGAGRGEAAVDATPAQVLRAYVTAMKPIAPRLSLERNRGELGAQLLRFLRTEEQLLGVAKIARTENRNVVALTRKGRRVKPPRVLADAHAELIRSGVRTARASMVFARRLEAMPGYDAVDDILLDFELENEIVAEQQTHWRQELTAQLRRQGVAVPLWLKSVGT